MLLKSELKKDFEKLNKNQNEPHGAYTIKRQDVYDKLVDNNISISFHHELVLQILHGCEINKVLESLIIMHMDQ